MAENLIYHAYCGADGAITVEGFDADLEDPIPEGMLTIATASSAEVLEAALAGTARRAYPKPRHGGETVYLVPGIPEAEGQRQAMDALLAYTPRLQAAVQDREDERAKGELDAGEEARS